MGQKFASIVTACLMGLDGSFGAKNIRGQDRIMRRTAYIRYVIKRLEDISMCSF